jgi:hypothetical protein
MKKETFSVQELKSMADPEAYRYFNKWVLDFFKREVLRESGRIDEYVIDPEFGQAMRQEVSYWNPNRSKHAEVFWLENYVFNQKTSMRNKILNAIAVKFVGMPTLTLVASNTADYSNIIDFDEYKLKGDYYHIINKNLEENVHRLKVWGATQLQTSLQTAARNFVREEENNPNIVFKLSHMIRWIDHLDKLGLSDVVQDPKNSLGDVCEWLKKHKGIGPYFSYHPPCNFSRCKDLPHIDEDDDYCLVGPGAAQGMAFVFPKVKLKNNDIMEKIILSVRKHQYEFFEFPDETALQFYKENLERNGYLTTFGTEITFCQFNCFLSIKDNPKLQEKRILPLTFEAFDKIALDLKSRLNRNTLEKFFT